MAEMDYFAAFDVSAPEGDTDTEVEQETADPAQVSEETGAEAPEVADPDEEPVNTEEETENQDADHAPEEKPQQSREENARFAAMRRRREMEEAVKKAETDTIARADRIIRELGIKNPMDNSKTIESLADLEKYQQAKSLREMQGRMKRGEMKPEDLEQMFAQTDLGKKVQDTVRQAESERERARLETANAKAAQQLREIQKLDPSVQSIRDIMESDSGQAFYEQVRRGNDLVTAYKIANMDRLIQNQTAIAAQKAANRVQSKAHLSSTAAHGRGAREVPDDVLASYRQFFPDASAAELRKMYEQYGKTKRG